MEHTRLQSADDSATCVTHRLVLHRLERVRQQARNHLHEDLQCARTNKRRLLRLLRTVHDEKETARKKKQPTFSNVVATLLGREEDDEARDAPADTPHRHIATAIMDMRALINRIDELHLTQDQTMLMDVTERSRRNLLAVSRDVRDFVVRTCCAMSLHDCAGML